MKQIANPRLPSGRELAITASGCILFLPYCCLRINQPVTRHSREGGNLIIIEDSHQVTNAFVADTWLAGYKVINDANNVLAHINLVVDAEKDRAEGEPKFIRGSAYFDLVRMYAKAWNDGDLNANPGVPLVLQPTNLITDSSKVKRNTVAEVYAQVISDLTDASEKCITAGNTYIFATNIAAWVSFNYYLCSGFSFS